MTDDVMANAPEPTNDPNADILNMIDYINAAEFQKANDIFKNEVEDRMSTALEQEKVAIAQGVGNDTEVEDADASEELELDADGEVIDVDADTELDPDEELTDEDIEAAVDELVDEEDEDDGA
jgi:hypothetical protein